MKRKHLDGETRKSKRPEGAAKLKAKKSRVHESVQGAETETVKSPELECKREKLSEKRSRTSKKKKASKSIEATQTEPREAKPKKKCKTKTTAPAVQDAEVNGEQQRRALQREIQQLVMRLRSEGRAPAEIKAATKELKARSWKPPKIVKEKQRLWEEDAAQKRKEHLQKQHDLVIIPIVWRGRHDKLDVLKAAEDIKACLSQQGLDVWLDGRRHLTPGQKFAHWEHRGVLLRVEIGPDDLKAGVCRVCLAKTPGDYQSVQRKRVGLPPSGTRSLLLRLKEWGLKQLEIERRDGDSEEEAPEEVIQAREGETTVQTNEEAPILAEDVQGNWTPRVEQRQDKGSKGTKTGKKRKKN